MSTTLEPVLPTRPVRERPRRKRVWLVILIAVAVLVGGVFGAYTASNAIAQSQWQSRIDAGDCVGVLRIPSFGDDYAVPILSGATMSTLRGGVGWYDGTSGPGEVGNFAVAGHSFGWGGAFSLMKSLRVGDEIIVEVGGAEFTYVVITAPTVLEADATDVLAPVPGSPERTPTKALITLTTADDVLLSPDRLIVIGELADQ